MRLYIRFFGVFVVVFAACWFWLMNLNRQLAYGQDAVETTAQSSHDTGMIDTGMTGDRPNPTSNTIFLPIILNGVDDGNTVSEVSPDSPSCLISRPGTIVLPVDQPFWYFVLNFDVWSTTGPVGCVVLHRSNEITPTTALAVPCYPNGEVKPTAAPGQAQFSGGFVECPINLMKEINDLKVADTVTGTIVLEPEYTYPQFTIYSTGQLSRVVTITQSLLANPIVSYQPITTTRPVTTSKPDLAFFAPLAITSGTDAVLVSYYRSRLNYQQVGSFAQCLFNVSAEPLPQTWSTRREEINEGIIRHKMRTIVCNFQRSPPLTFWTNGGAFFIGYSPLNPTLRLHGVLDEVIVDPPGSTIPPT